MYLTCCHKPYITVYEAVHITDARVGLYMCTQ